MDGFTMSHFHSETQHKDADKMTSVETHRGDWIYVDRNGIMNMSRNELQEYLELRGHAVYDDEPTSLLRECALEDLFGEDGISYSADPM